MQRRSPQVGEIGARGSDHGRIEGLAGLDILAEELLSQAPVEMHEATRPRRGLGILRIDGVEDVDDLAPAPGPTVHC